MNLIQEQAPPQPNDKPAVWDLVLADMRARDQEGRRKYGVPLQPLNGRDALVDAYQEALDLCVYLRQAIWERDAAATTATPSPDRCVPRYEAHLTESTYEGNPLPSYAAPPPSPPRCAVPFFCDQTPDSSGLCPLHRCTVPDCTNPRHLRFGVCLKHCDAETQQRHEAEQQRRTQEAP